MTFAGKPAVQLGTDHEEEPPAGKHHFPGARAGRIVGPNADVAGRPQERLDDPQAVGPGNADRAGRGAGAQPQCAADGRQIARLFGAATLRQAAEKLSGLGDRRRIKIFQRPKRRWYGGAAVFDATNWSIMESEAMGSSLFEF